MTESSRQPEPQLARSGAAVPSGRAAGRPPSRKQVERDLAVLERRLEALSRRQEALQRRQVELEETRRRQVELEKGRREVAEKLARAAAELSAAEAEARREADRLARTVAGLREALEKVRAIDESRWTKETYQRELSHALTTIEFARMEWNAAAREYPQLEGKSAERADSARPGIMERVEGVSFWTLARIGLGLTFPLWALGAIGLAIAAAVFLSR